MPRPTVKVYVVKHLSWAYNDECTVPHSATFERAFRTRDAAELYRRELELRLGPASEDDEYRDSDWGDHDDDGQYLPLSTRWDEARVREWLGQFGLPDPPRSEHDGRPFWTPEWLARTEADLGRTDFLRFCEIFDHRYYYQVIETELEL